MLVGSMYPGISETARPLVRAALAARLKELAAGPPARRAEPAKDPEEALRKLMVGMLPRMSGLAQDAWARGDLCSLLLSLEDAARTDDIRFLDAWNSIYEGALPRREAFLADPAWGEALSAYARVLEAAISRLSG